MRADGFRSNISSKIHHRRVKLNITTDYYNLSCTNETDDIIHPHSRIRNHERKSCPNTPARIPSPAAVIRPLKRALGGAIAPLRRNRSSSTRGKFLNIDGVDSRDDHDTQNLLGNSMNEVDFACHQKCFTMAESSVSCIREEQTHELLPNNVDFSWFSSPINTTESLNDEEREGNGESFLDIKGNVEVKNEMRTKRAEQIIHGENMMHEHKCPGGDVNPITLMQLSYPLALRKNSVSVYARSIFGYTTSTGPTAVGHDMRSLGSTLGSPIGKNETNEINVDTLPSNPQNAQNIRYCTPAELVADEVKKCHTAYTFESKKIMCSYVVTPSEKIRGTPILISGEDSVADIALSSPVEPKTVGIKSELLIPSLRSDCDLRNISSRLEPALEGGAHRKKSQQVSPHNAQTQLSPTRENIACWNNTHYNEEASPTGVGDLLEGYYSCNVEGVDSQSIQSVVRGESDFIASEDWTDQHSVDSNSSEPFGSFIIHQDLLFQCRLERDTRNRYPDALRHSLERDFSSSLSGLCSSNAYDCTETLSEPIEINAGSSTDLPLPHIPVALHDVADTRAIEQMQSAPTKHTLDGGTEYGGFQDIDRQTNLCGATLKRCKICAAKERTSNEEEGIEISEESRPIKPATLATSHRKAHSQMPQPLLSFCADWHVVFLGLHLFLIKAWVDHYLVKSFQFDYLVNFMLAVVV